MKKLNLDEQRARIAERQRWEAENPEAARAEEEARAADERRLITEREAEAVRQEVEARQRRARETAPESLERMGAPKRAVRAWAEGLKDGPALRAVRRMVAEQKSFCLLSGKQGRGKTTAAVGAMADRILEARGEEMPALFIRAAEGARLGLYSEHDRNLMHQMLTAGVLVVDDLGAEALPRHEEGSVWLSILDEVLDVRYGNLLHTVLTTNLDATAFRTRYGARIADRIRHSGIIEAVDTSDGKSMRTPGEG